MNGPSLLVSLLVAFAPETTPFESPVAGVISKGYQFTEGPTWVPEAKMFVFCDLSGDTVYQWTGEQGKAPEVLLKPANRVVGSTASNGEIIQVSTSGRSLIKWRLDREGKPTPQTPFATKFGEKRLGGMNDLAAHPNGSVYVTHATWFIKPEDAEFDHSGVIRAKSDGTVSIVASDIARPNGICFNREGTLAYVTEFSSGRILRFTVDAKDGSFKDRSVFAELNALAQEKSILGRGGADGIRCDRDGNVYSTGPGGIWALSPSGRFLGHLPIRATNLAFGGADGKTLLITTGDGAATVRTRVSGVWKKNTK